MPGYIERVLQRFVHSHPARRQDSPHAWQKPAFGAKVQFAPEPDNSPVLDAKDHKKVQEVIGCLLFYARAIDNTMLPALGTIASLQAGATEDTMKRITHLLNYAASNPEGVVRFFGSEMCLWVDSDSSFLSEAKARSRFAGYHYLSDMPKDPNRCPEADDPPPMHNGAINVPCQIMREVLASAAEAELGGVFHNAKEACPIRICLEELGHPQPPTPIKTDNSTANGIANGTVKQKRSKAIDMRFYWVGDRVRQKQFYVYWQPGAGNKADYFTKHHPTAHHRNMRPRYLYDKNKPLHSRNYYECLDDEDPDSSLPDLQTGICEGVLKTGTPAAPLTPVSSVTLPVTSVTPITLTTDLPLLFQIPTSDSVRPHS
jgi:hypothetical protein